MAVHQAAPETLTAAAERCRSLPASAPESVRCSAALYALVLDCSLPRPTRGSDHIVNLRLLDASVAPEAPTGVDCIVFSRDARAMPQAAAPGDVILLQNATVNFWNSKVQLLAKLAPNKPFAYHLFAGAPGAPLEPYRGAGYGAGTWRPGPRHAGALSALRELGAARGAAATGGAGASEAAQQAIYLRRIQELRVPPPCSTLVPLAPGGVQPPAAAPTGAREPGEERQPAQHSLGQQPGMQLQHPLLAPGPGQQQQQQQEQQQQYAHGRPEAVDVRCMVLAVDGRDPGEAVLYVWDSTDARPMPRGLQLQPSRVRNVNLVARARQRLLPLAPVDGVEVVDSLPPLGTALPVVVPRARGAPPPQLPRVGEWIKLRNVGLQLHQLALVVGSISRITPCADDPHTSAAMRDRMARGQPASWVQPPLTHCPVHGSLPLSSLRQALQQRGSGRSGTFRAHVRLTSHWPLEPAAFCRRTRAGGWAWAAKLQLEDATARCDALLLGREGERLLGLAPRDLAGDAYAAAQVRALLARLMHIDACGTDDDGAGAVWLEVVLTSCYSQAAAEAAGALCAGGGGGGARGDVGDAAAGARAAAQCAASHSCVYLLHDTVLRGAQLVTL